MNYYTKAATQKLLPCTYEEFKEIYALLSVEDDESDYPHGMSVEYWPLTDGSEGLFLYGDFQADPLNLPEQARKLLGKLVSEESSSLPGIPEPHLIIDVSYSADGVDLGSEGGTRYLLFQDGEIIEAEFTYTRKGVTYR